MKIAVFSSFLLVLVSTMSLGQAGKDAKQTKEGDIQIAAAKDSTYYGKWKTGELLVKYCDKPSWQFEKAKDLVVFRGVLKKTDKELLAKFKVIYGWVDKSNTRKDWIVIDDGAVIGGKTEMLWKPLVFVDEFRLMGGDKKDK